MEVKKEVKVFHVEYACDACGEGKLKPTNMALSTYPAQYPHKCDKCGIGQTFFHRYPRTVYEEVEGA